MVWTGEAQAWDLLAELGPEDVQARANATFHHESSTYELSCLGQDIFVSLTKRKISGNSHSGEILLKELGEYSILSILRYLIHAKNLPPSGKLVRPSDLPGGEIFLKGTHVLPLDKIVGNFDNNSGAFLSKGMKLGGTQLDYGDISLKLSPFPRIPIVLIVWYGDEAFPSRTSLLFDSSCSSHLSTDIIWSTAMMSVEMMLINT